MAKRKPKLKTGTRQYGKPKAAVTVPPCPWDMGAMGQANRVGLVEEQATDVTPDGETPNPNGVKRMRRIDMLEVWHRKGVLSARAFNAGESLRNAFCATQKAPGWPDNDKVQSSPKPDHAVTVQIGRLSTFAAIYGLVIQSDRAILDHCILSERIPASLVHDGRRPYAGPRYQDGLDHLRAALERLADAMENGRKVVTHGRRV